MLLSGGNNLNNRKSEIDALNVFPVPDGDTGTNMSMTFTNGISEVNRLKSDELPLIGKTLSRGLLMCARVNSGVILSQIFRGFYQAIDDRQEMNSLELAEAMFNGAKVAYKAVMRPVEGTILTVVRESSEYALMFVQSNPECSIEEYINERGEQARISLDHTPELLPVLKEVGVVDSGGTGLLAVFEGFKAYLDGHAIEANEAVAEVAGVQADIENDEFGYCTEFILRLSDKKIKTFNEDKLRNRLAQLGNSLVVVQDEDLVKVHVHTLTPGEALNIGQRYGEFIKLKIENMQEQHTAIQSGALAEPEKVEEKEYAIVAVAAGEGLKDLFTECRADYVISGGQTMNPSTEDFVEAIKGLHAKQAFVLPNNSNIIMAAKQAAAVLEDRDIHVFDTKSIPQGLSACIMFNPEGDVETNIAEMQEAIDHVKSGQLTYAIKDTTFDGLDINAGDYMGIFEKDIVVSEADKMAAAKALADAMIDAEAEIVTLIYGEDATEEAANELANYIMENYDIEVDIQNGLQPVYSFILGVE